MRTIYTIGHSNHAPGDFLRLLALVQIEVLVDIRSRPNSAWAAFARRGNLSKLISSAGMRYVYMGDTLGGLPSDEDSYDTRTGKANYDIMRQKESFKEAILKVLDVASRNSICLVCAEESPAQCHRSLLVGKALSDLGACVLHLRADGRVQTEEELLKERAGAPSDQAAFEDQVRDGMRSHIGKASATQDREMPTWRRN